MFKIIEKTKIWFISSLLIIAIGIGFMIYRGGLNFGIDFKGGSQITIDFKKSFNKSDVDAIVKKYLDDATTNTINNTQLEIKTKYMDTTKVGNIKKDIKDKYKIEDKDFSEQQIGKSVGSELTKNSFIALAISLVIILAYIAIRFEFNFGIAAIVALIHDVLITLTVYSVFNLPVNTPFIAAILTIIGYSMSDTIVIFDRIRENTKKYRKMHYVELANRSITQTFARSINTALTTLITTSAVYFFVPSVRDFAFPLIVGIVSGAYSSIFIASPIWVMLRNRKEKIKEAA
ncbi:protein translocase subunit SecF [Clostridium manihotivorum]|uniref:Protein-export membrane protein SecF n=1 Tax=Clostridium manihotivorum TaxID=2320868 RepID=A0A3R5QT74_9CLOT|nr:protein translocase subunit SecF [Clostridium manihotivorum]QAA31922.1 protein translocase subunit SecF [Clostridium manihotivorum]